MPSPAPALDPRLALLRRMLRAGVVLATLTASAFVGTLL